MGLKYKVVFEGGEDEIVEKKSRFIATVIPAETEDEALLTLDSLEAISAFFGQGAFTLDVSAKLPAFANALFPIPLFFSIPDMI